jgi:hypothetical protein
VPHRLLAQLGEEGRGHVRVGGQHLEARLGAVLRVADALQCDERGSVVVEHVHTERGRGPLGVGSDRHVEPVDLPTAEPAPLGIRHQVAQGAVVPLIAASHAHELGVAWPAELVSGLVLRSRQRRVRAFGPWLFCPYPAALAPTGRAKSRGWRRRA